MKLFSKRYLDLIFLFLLTLTFPLFFYKLGQSSLVSWDEAWYADIARNILRTGNWLNLSWNGQPFFDHPPFGFWIMALIFQIFGESEFWARFPSALAGLSSLYILYFLGKKLFHPVVGFISALCLTTTPWFILRARSGNLDSILTMLFLLTFLLALLSAEKQKHLKVFFLSLAALILTKTIIPIALFPVLFFILWKKVTLKNILLGALILLIPLSYFTYQSLIHTDFLSTYIEIGTRGSSLKANNMINLLIIKDYLYFGIGGWFWPTIISLLGLLLFKQRRLVALPLFCVSFLLPFILSPKVQIWHLIPVYPFLLLSFSGFSFLLAQRLKKVRYIFFISVFILAAYFNLPQTKKIWREIIDIPAYISDEAILSRKASLYPYPLLTDGDFDPVATFYSKKDVLKIKRDDLESLFSKKEPFVLITNDWRVKEASIPPDKYQLLAKDRDKVLLLHLTQLNK